MDEQRACQDMIAGGGGSSGDFSYLGLLARAKVALESAVEVAVPADAVRRYVGQPRRYFNADAIRRLSESIAASGQTTAGIIRRNVWLTEYELIDGERRWRAVQMIGSGARPLYRARLVEADDDVVQYLISGVANFNREGHTPLETCDTIARMVGFKIPMTEIAALLGVSEYWAYQMHHLRRLVPEVKAMLDPARPQRDRLPTTAAIEISKCAERLQLELAQRVLRRDVTLSGLRAEVVATSRAGGAPVHTRGVPRGHRWGAVRRQAEVIERTARGMVVALTDEALVAFVGRRPRAEIEQVEGQLRAAGAFLASCQDRLAKLRGGKK